MTYTTWDIETSIKASYKRKANPFDNESFVVMQGWKRKGGEVEGEYFGRRGAPDSMGLPEDWFTKHLAGTKVLVGQNIKFDLLYALRDKANHLAWMDWVAAGGLVWDCQLAEYLLEGMEPQSHMLSMDELAPRYGGNTKFDEVKALWQAGVSTEDINPDLLRRYLLGTETEHGDIGNTELIFLGQLQRARATGQLKSIYLNMGSLLCTIEMELNGMAVDVQEGYRQAEEIAARLAEVSVELNAHLPPDLPFEFNWGSAKQKSAIIFGGDVPYKARVPILDDAGKQAYAQKEVLAYVLEGDAEPVAVDRYDKALALVEANPGKYAPLPERVMFKSGKNKGEYKTKKIKVNDLEKPKSRLEDFLYRFPGVTKPNPRWEGATPGQYSTAAEVIGELAGRGIPFLDALGKVTALSKDLTTYYITTDPDTGQSKGMLTLVQADGIIHHMLNHTSTVTGRFSSSNPNLQNLPKGEKSSVKALFKSRFEGGVVIQSDFKSLEVYVQAILTKAAQLIEDLKQGLDMHCVRVSQKEGITYEEAYRLCVTEGVAEWKSKRTKAKVFSFQRAYGAGASTISEKGKMPLEDVEALIIAEDGRYPEIERYYGQLTEAIKQTATFSGQRVMHPDIQGLVCNLKKGHWRAPDGKLYTWREQPSPGYLAKRGQASSFTPTEIKNYPVQGTGGEWAKAAMWLAIRAFYARRNFDGLALLVNQVHDALYADAAPPAKLEAAALLHACMEEASAFMEWYFDWEIPVPVPSDTTWGSTMLEETPLPEEFPALVKQNRAAVRAAYIAGYQPTCETQLPLAA